MASLLWELHALSHVSLPELTGGTEHAQQQPCSANQPQLGFKKNNRKKITGKAYNYLLSQYTEVT